MLKSKTEVHIHDQTNVFDSHTVKTKLDKNITAFSVKLFNPTVTLKYGPGSPTAVWKGKAERALFTLQV